MIRNRIQFNRQFSVEEPIINLTPLIDVVFVVLIMFIVVAPLLELDEIELADNGSNSMDVNSHVQENSSITIHVRADNTILLNHQVVTLSSLTDQLIKAKLQFPKATPQLYHHKKASFGTYQSVKNSAEDAGFSRLDIILNPA